LELSAEAYPNPQTSSAQVTRFTRPATDLTKNSLAAQFSQRWCAKRQIAAAPELWAAPFVEQALSQPGDFQASPDDGADIDGVRDQGPHLCLPRRSRESAFLEIDWTKKLQHFI
jgi:hypothetical protein